MTTPIDNFKSYKQCEKIDALKVDAYTELDYDPENESNIILKTSWGESKLDIDRIAKGAETQTSLKLYPADNPTGIRYTGENLEPQDIYGGNLALTIPMTNLKDIDRETPISGGEVYMYNVSTNKFAPYDLQTVIDSMTDTVENLNAIVLGMQSTVLSLTESVNGLTPRVIALESALDSAVDRISTLETSLADAESRITELETTLTKPEGTPDNAVVAWGNANMYSQTDKSTGTFVHDTSTTETGDRTINSDVS